MASSSYPRKGLGLHLGFKVLPPPKKNKHLHEFYACQDDLTYESDGFSLIKLILKLFPVSVQSSCKACYDPTMHVQ